MNVLHNRTVGDATRSKSVAARMTRQRH
jgi:hypothetical protein